MSEQQEERDGTTPARGSAKRQLQSGRQSRVPGEPKEIRHVVRVSPDVEQRLAAKALARRVTIARLMVESALAGDSEAARLKSLLVDELFGVQRMLGKVGVNINQIARATNASLEYQDDTGPAIMAFGEVCRRLDGVLAQLEQDLRG